MAASSKWIEGVTPHSTVEEAARRSLEPRLAAVTHALPMAAYLAEHDVEYVHRLRVATRRATAALKLYRDCLAPKQVQWTKKRLRTIRRAAGDARDLDVLADRLARDYGDPVAPVIELIARDRAVVQPAIVRIADHCRDGDQLVRKTAKLLSSLGRSEPHSDIAPSRRFGEWAPQQFAKVANEFVAQLPNESSDPPALHQFRIAGKALRYAIELVAPAFPPALRKELYPNIEALQERLGHVQDHVAAIDRCRAWRAAVHADSLQETLRELADAEARGLADSIRDFHSWWTPDRAQQVLSMLPR